MKTTRIFFLLIGICFMGACAYKTNTYSFDDTRSVKVDESKVVLTRFPVQLEEINDSVIATLNSFQQLSLYNINSGKNSINFSVKSVNFDSLIQHTFQKKYEGERIYNYNKGFMSGLASIAEKIGLFEYEHHQFYINVSTLVDVTYLKDSSEILKVYSKEKIRQLKKEHKDLKVSTTGFVNFLIVTDDQFNLKEITPLYTPPVLKKNNYFPIYEKAFYADKNNVYVFLFKDDKAYQTRRSRMKLNSYYTAAINLKDETKTRLLLDKNDIDYSSFSFDEYLTSFSKFYNHNQKLLFFNSKEICEVESGKKIFLKKFLNTNEWINNFYITDDNEMVMVNYNVDKRQHPTEFQKSYAIDSVNTGRIKVFDLKTSQWISEKKLPDGFHFPFLVTKNKVIFLSKDKQHYYFNTIKYYEN